MATGIEFARTSGGYPSLPPFLWLHYKDPALLAERMRMPGSGGESRADVAILIGIKVRFLALIVLPARQVLAVSDSLGG